MKVLVLGSGGREHALAWRIGKDPSTSEVYLHPGNAGTWKQGIPTLGDVSPTDVGALVRAAKRLGIGLTVIGPETLLAQGYADFFRESGFLVVGPGIAGARLETSKAFAKGFLNTAAIPTARFQSVASPDQVRHAVDRSFPSVLKLDGLAAGKGVVVAQTSHEVEDFIGRVWERQEFGPGPHIVLVEEFLVGQELSYIGLCDGKDFVPLSSASDYKRLSDGNQGPNTGGMGAVSPSALMSKALEDRIRQQIVAPTLQQLAHLRMQYRGALYFGLMVTKDGSPYVLEFNARFGDPETQALVMRLQGDFTAVLVATAEGKLGAAAPLRWNPQSCVYVVATAQGYPGTPRNGDAIEGVFSGEPGTELFYSAVHQSSRGLATSGGRVLGVGALGADVAVSRQNAYKALSGVHWPGMHFRNDIGL